MTTEIKDKVAALYDRFPYPNYPLFGKPRWQDGYLTSSYFAGRLAGQAGSGRNRAIIAPSGDTLVAGCGEILPYILRKWEPPEHCVVNVDLSDRSLRRGRIRTLLCRGSSEFHRTGIVEFLARCTESGRQFSHIETFGMLHHMDDPGPAVESMASRLLPGGTIRVMVYNSPARWWIHMLQDRFKESGIDILGNDPIQATRQAKAAILNLATTSPQLQEKVRAIGRSTLDNPARIADMFLHPHELRWPVERWFKLFQDAGLELCGIFDRYGELDDLPNPLITPDQAAIELPARAKNHCFEGNLETIWRKPFPGESATIKSTPQSTIPRNARHLTRLKIRMPPLIWFEFEETRDLAVANRMRIWHAFLDGRQIAPNVWGKSDAALQRLSRLGAIMHDQIEENFRKIAVAPMVTHPSE